MCEHAYLTTYVLSTCPAQFFLLVSGVTFYQLCNDSLTLLTAAEAAWAHTTGAVGAILPELRLPTKFLEYSPHPPSSTYHSIGCPPRLPYLNLEASISNGQAGLEREPQPGFSAYHRRLGLVLLLLLQDRTSIHDCSRHCKDGLMQTRQLQLGQGLSIHGHSAPSADTIAFLALQLTPMSLPLLLHSLGVSTATHMATEGRGHKAKDF